MGNPVISVAGAEWSDSASALKTLSVSPVSTGDLLVFMYESLSTTTGASAVSGGGVSAWANASSYYDTDDSAYVSVWWGVVTSTGSATITVTDTGGTGFGQLWAREFTASPAAWSVVTQNPAAGSSGVHMQTSTTAVFPALAPSAGGNNLYIGAGCSIFSDFTGGSTPGFTYEIPNVHLLACYDTALNAAAGPTATMLASDFINVLGVLFVAGSSGGGGPAAPGNRSLPGRVAVVASNSGWRNAGHSR